MIRLEKRSRGKMVTVIGGLDAVASDLPALLSALKSACGAGGSIESQTMTLQGDQRDKAAAFLQARGYSIRRREP